MGPGRQGQRFGQSRPADGRSDQGVDGSTGERNGGDEFGFTASARAGATHGVVARQRRGGRSIAAHWPGRSRIGRSEPAAHRGRPRARADTIDRASAANDPWLVSVRISPTPGIECPRGSGCGCAGTIRCATTGPGAAGPAVSPGRLFRNPACGRSPFGPYDASRGGPSARGDHGPRARPATRAQGRTTVVPAVFLARFGIGRLSTFETRRLHVVGGYTPDDSEGRSLVGPLNRTASPRWRGRW